MRCELGQCMAWALHAIKKMRFENLNNWSGFDDAMQGFARRVDAGHDKGAYAQKHSMVAKW